MQSQDAHFCRLESAPQKIALSGRVLLLSSGLTTLMYTSCPKYQVSRFCTRKFHMPALSRNTRIAVQAPGNTCNQVDSVKLFIDYRGLLYRKPRFIVTPKHRKKSQDRIITCSCLKAILWFTIRICTMSLLVNLLGPMSQKLLKQRN